MWIAVRDRYSAGVLSVVGWLLLWEFVSRILIANQLFLAAPSQIVYAIYTLARSGELEKHIAISAVEFAIGYIRRLNFFFQARSTCRNCCS